jgi:ketosteroid isomerase-like protein
MKTRKCFPLLLILLWTHALLTAQSAVNNTVQPPAFSEQRPPVLASAEFDHYYWAVDFAKSHSGRRADMLSFLEENWKYLRDTALARGYIKAYRVLETRPDSSGNFDFVLMTAFPDSIGWAKSEATFGPIIKALRPNGPVLPGGLKRGDVVKSLVSKDAQTVFAAAARTLPQIHIPDKAENRERLKAINRDIWTPFSEAYASNDAEKYLALHTPDFIRANGGEWAGTRNLGEYGKGVRNSFAAQREKGNKTRIDFSFFERAAGPESASERGIYRYTSTNKDGVKQVFYGKFHVFHRLVDGVWKIAVDYDSDEDKSVGEADFNCGLAPDVFIKN